jgi:hypothetical protein
MPRPDGPRPTVVGPDSGPEAPFPLRLNGKVIQGFGRGSSEVGQLLSPVTVDQPTSEPRRRSACSKQEHAIVFSTLEYEAR